MDCTYQLSLLDKILYRTAAAVFWFFPHLKDGCNIWTALYYSRKPVEIDHVPEYPELIKKSKPERTVISSCGPTHIDRADFFALQPGDFYTPDGYSYEYCRQTWVAEIAKLDAEIDEANAMDDAYFIRMTDGSPKSDAEWDDYLEWAGKLSDYRYGLKVHRQRGLAIITKIDKALGRPAA